MEAPALFTSRDRRVLQSNRRDDVTVCGVQRGLSLVNPSW